MAMARLMMRSSMLSPRIRVDHTNYRSNVTNCEWKLQPTRRRRRRTCGLWLQRVGTTWHPRRRRAFGASPGEVRGVPLLFSACGGACGSGAHSRSHICAAAGAYGPSSSMREAGARRVDQRRRQQQPQQQKQKQQLRRRRRRREDGVGANVDVANSAVLRGAGPDNLSSYTATSRGGVGGRRPSTPPIWTRKWMADMQTRSRNGKLSANDKAELAACARMEVEIVAKAEELRGLQETLPTIDEVALFASLGETDELEECLLVARRARALLLNEFRPLMAKQVNIVARRYRNLLGSAVDPSSLMLPASAGMNIGIDNYDATKGSLPMFATVTVRNELLKFVKRLIRSSSIEEPTEESSTRLRELKIEQQSQRAGRLGPEFSSDILDNVFVASDRPNISDAIIDDTARESLRGEIDSIFEDMPPRVRNVLRLRYGFYFDRDGNLVEQSGTRVGESVMNVAKRYGISERESRNLDTMARKLLMSNLTRLEADILQLEDEDNEGKQ